MRNNFSTKVNLDCLISTLWHLACIYMWPGIYNHNFYGIMVMMTKYYQKGRRVGSVRLWIVLSGCHNYLVEGPSLEC